MVTGYGCLGQHAPVFHGEVFAIHEAAQSLLLNKPNQDHIHFFIDSKTAILALTKKYFISQTVLECFYALMELANTNSVTLHWVKAHVGHTLNERADELAKLGTEASNITILPRTWASVKAEIANNTHNQWTKRWHNEGSCRQTRLMIPDITPNLTKYLLKLNREEASLVVQFATGHNYLMYHQVKCGNATNPLCRLCSDKEETAWHLLTDCPAIQFTRVEIFLTYEISRLPHIRPLLLFLKHPKIYNLLIPAARLDTAAPVSDEAED